MFQYQLMMLLPRTLTVLSTPSKYKQLHTNNNNNNNNKKYVLWNMVPAP